ncbi:MAG: glutamyl-Q tRNA(Asp) synthetase [Paracoccaceae bacterium]|jgi:glutamyl-Q tRNA(Asp) synthetase
MTPPPSPTERFAPSPNGRLHLGHAFSAMLAHDAARAAGGRFLLRIEDIDRARSKSEHEAAILTDLEWLGVRWDGVPWRQSDRGPAYAAALADLGARGLLYPCACTRGDIAGALDAPQEGTPGPDGAAYPGLCRPARPAPIRGDAPGGTALRLNMRAAIDAMGGPRAVAAMWWEELDQGPEGQRGRQELDPDWLVELCGDVVLARKDVGTSYHLSVTVDDAAQAVSHVTRGRDLFHATQLHRALQALLALPVPRWRHHRLIRDAGGRRLAKRDRDQGVAELRDAGATPADIRAMLGLPPAG